MDPKTCIEVVCLDPDDPGIEHSDASHQHFKKFLPQNSVPISDSLISDGLRTRRSCGVLSCATLGFHEKQDIVNEQGAQMSGERKSP
jgi:hypothetical protein